MSQSSSVVAGYAPPSLVAQRAELSAPDRTGPKGMHDAPPEARRLVGLLRRTLDRLPE